jgi:lipopolysaccharide biosynthesis regulator YciM
LGAALILFLLGFGALAAGTLIGRYYVPDDRHLRRTARHAKSYMHAVNHLLARDRDAAIEELKDVVQENVDDIEPYFALGALFRSRGECERAIRVHQAIDLREGASKKVRLRARYELGLDFRAAGMPRRSTRAMEDCLAQDTKHVGALRALCGLYEEQGRYAEAASAWQRLRKMTGEESATREHHLLVAAAQRAMAIEDLDSARRLMRDAEKIDDESPHLLAAAAELAAVRGNPKGASARLRQALSVAPDLAAYLVPGLVEAQRQLVADERKKSRGAEETPSDTEAAKEEERALQRASAELAEVLETSGPDPHLLMAVAELRSRFDPETALADFQAIGEEYPDHLAARVASARLALAGQDDETIARELVALVGPGGALAWAIDGVWRCSNCGHRSDEFFWRCDDCRRWGAIRLDVGRAAQEPPPRRVRERREHPRESGASRAILGASAQALPEPALDSGLSDDELREAGSRPSLLGRVGGWFGSAFRRDKKESARDASDRPRLEE